MTDTNTPDNPLRFTPEDIARYKRLHAPTHTADELTAFFAQCERTQLDPWSRQIYTLKRKSYQDGQSVEKAMTQVSIDGLRLQAERSGQYAGQIGPFWCGADGKWVDVWLGPMRDLMAARVGVYRKGWPEPIFGVARFDAYCQKKKDGALTNMWSNMGDVMIAKCAEALALRKACPAELSGLYTTEEMLQADPPEKETTAAAPNLTAAAPTVQQTVTPPKTAPAPAPTPTAPKAAAAPAPKPAPAKSANPTAPAPVAQGAGVPPGDWKDLDAEIDKLDTPEKANAGLPAILGMKEPDRSAGIFLFKRHRIAKRWELGKDSEGRNVVSPIDINAWTLQRAKNGMEIVRAMTGDERAEAIQAIEVRAHEQGWQFDKVKVEVSAS